MSKLIGTAGHVDHGKTTLIQALTGIDADRLPEEKQRGMTIDIGFAFMDLPDVGRVSIVDVPGHEKFLTNMLVGALGIDVALLCIAADESVMPQTREHLQILELLPVEKLVVAMTRADLADEETRELATIEINELIEASRFGSAPVIATSATTGEGLRELRDLLNETLKGQQTVSQGKWYLPIDRAFTVKGHGCVVTGTMAQGEAAVGDKVFLEPGHIESRVRSIHWHGDILEKADKGKRTALNLGGVKVEDVQRGMAVGEPGVLFETQCLDARIRWIGGPCKHGLRVRVSIGADEVFGKVFLNEHDEDLIQLRLERNVACALNQPLIVRRYSPPDLLAGGRIVVPQSKPRRKTEDIQVVEHADSLEEGVLQALEGQVAGMPTEQVCRVLGHTPQALGDVFESLTKQGRALGFAGLWLTAEAFAESSQRFLAALAKIHAEQPMIAMHSREKVVQEAKLPWSGKPLDRIVAALVSEGRLTSNGTLVKDPQFNVTLTGRQREFLDRIIEELDRAGVNVPGTRELAEAINAPTQAIDEILRLGCEAGELVRVAEGIYYPKRQIDKFKQLILDVSKGKPFNAAQFRDSVGTTRKFAIPLLEYFDSIRFTTRTGDLRMVNQR
jgi:selenocysteine-specific elongation factor